MTRVVAVTSGKAGVGKTHLSVGLALQCARKGLRTCLFDADMGSANAALLLGLIPGRTVSDVVAGSCSLRDILMTSHGIDIIPSSTGRDAIADLAPASFARLAQEFSTLGSYDLVIFDISSSLASNIQALVAAVPEVLLVVTPDPNALTDAYALVKRLQRQHHRAQLRVIVNQAPSDRQAQHTYEKFREVVRVYQGVDLQLLGKVPYDKQITDIIVSETHSPLASESPVDHALAELADRFVHAVPEIDTRLSLQQFWSQLTGIEFPAVVSPQAVADADVVSGPFMNIPSQAVTVEFNERLMQLETGMETVLQELQAIRDMPNLYGAASKYDDTERLEQTTQTRSIDLRSSRNNTDQDNPARFVRNGQRSTPIDALQLRRVVGRMLVKATPIDAPADAPPVKISVDQLQVESGNDFSLRPGRYTRISLHCQLIRKPDSFIEEIFSTCAISGCKVRHLGSHVRYWVTSGRDGCILLDGDNNDRNCVQVYMASGGNSLLEAESVEPVAVPRLRKVTNEAWDAGAAPERLLGKYPHQRLLIEDAGGDPQEVFRLLRRERSPLLCAFHKADDGPAAGHLRESSP